MGVAPDAAWITEPASPARLPPSPLARFVREIPDFPKPGVGFKDITPLLGDAAAFRAAVDALCAPFAGQHIDKVLGIEARGFILAAPVAYALHAGFVPVRKPGKLPHDIEQEEYELEYGTDLLEIHRDAVHADEKVVVVDDVIATGGTAVAATALVERLGGVVAGVAVVVELGFLGGRAKLVDRDFTSLITYD